MSLEKTADLWWKNAIIYCLDVETFNDSNGDGIGDFPGLTHKIDYLAGLGVTCLWLMPFYPSPNLDDGYDVADHYAIDPRLGTFGDFTEFMHTARDRGLRVIADLVINHTSTEHHWFREARKSRDSRYRDFYVWRDEIPEDGPTGVVFPGEQGGLWEWDPEAGQYYLHRFYPHQPDLNVASERVREEVRKIIGFWMAQGLSGFRVDAIPFFLEIEGIAGDEMEVEPHDYLRDVRAFMDRRDGNTILLGEVNLEPKQQRAFFGDEDGDEMQMLFNFYAMQAMYLSLAREDATPLSEALLSLPDLPSQSQWASFARNHDELTLDRLSDSERQEVFEAFGPDEDMQIYGRGLRRRLPPMLAGDQARIRMVYSLMFTLPGAPCLFYGEEIGMAENLDVPGRLSVRTPMQWASSPTAGFSTAPRDALIRPIVTSEAFGPEAINVEDQQSDQESLLNWFERAIRIRREMPEIGWGAWEILEHDSDSVLALRFDWEGATSVVAHNLSGEKAALRVDLRDLDWVKARDRLNGVTHVPSENGTLELDLDASGYSWLELVIA